jgi:glutamine cyclotransferase
MQLLPRFFFLLLLLPFLCACASAEPTKLDYAVVNTYEHSTDFFTQGLLFYQERLYESTGQYGESQLIRYADDFSAPRIRRSLEPRYFGEGIAVHKGQLYLLTWQSQTGFVYDPAAFAPLGSFSYQGQGWGLTSDGETLWMSNGSATLNQIDTDGTILSSLLVTIDGQPLDRLNELEYINGLIFANRWYDNAVYLIDRTNGEVIAQLDLSELAIPQLSGQPNNVLNGIAWNPEKQTLWITGKNWSEIYELEIEFSSP